MDILLSLPIASYFFSSSLTSWSTSMNLLFFYMTWSTLVMSHSGLKIELLGFAAVRIFFWLVPSLLFLLFDTLLPSLSETIKYNGSSALPPRDAKALSKLLALALTNLAIESAVQALISLGLSHFLQTPVFRTSTTLPLPWQMIKHIALLFAAREVLTYHVHRSILHASSFKSGRSKSTNSSTQTSRIAALHSTYAHSRGAAPPFSLLLLADHPIPFLLHRFVPLYLPALALSLYPSTNPLHLLTFFAFVLLATLEETLATSGYTVVPGILMGGVARRTALHYCSSGRRGTGNYGCWGVLDWIHGTGLGGSNVMEDVRDEADKHRLKERGEKKAGNVGDFMAEAMGNGPRRSGRTRKERSRG